MHRYDLTAIDLAEGETQIRLRRRNAYSTAAPAAAPLMAMPSAPAWAPAAAPQAAAPVAAAPEAPKAPSGVVVESPMVGTFYASGSPDTPPFISVGSQVRENSTVCVIEAMKVFTDIPAGVNGTVVEILVKNGQSVEFGAPLFRIEPA